MEYGLRCRQSSGLERTLRDSSSVFTSLTPPEQSEALQCMLKGVTGGPGELVLDIFELGEFDEI